MTKKTQLLVIALDALDVDLMQRWTSEGHLPHLKALERSSRFQRTRNQPGVFAGSVWPSIGSGLGAGHVGRYYSTQTEPGGYGNQRFLPRDLPVKPFWDELSAAGRRVAVMNVPKFPASGGVSRVPDGPPFNPRLDDFPAFSTERPGGDEVIPTLLLTVLHYLSLVAVVAALLLLGRHYLRPSGTE